MPTKMTRKQAKGILFRLINSEVLSEEVVEELTTLANVICNDAFDKCDPDPRCKHGYPNHCEGCNFLQSDINEQSF